MSGVLSAISRGGGDILRLDDAVVSSFVLGGTSTSKWKIDADGGVYESRSNVSGGAFVKVYDWVLPNSSASKYECAWSVGTNLPDTTPAAADTYVALTVDRTWEETVAGSYEDCTFTAKIRLIGSSTDLKTALVSMDADGSP